MTKSSYLTRIALLLVVMFPYPSISQDLNLDNITELKQLYLDREWFKADSLFNAKIKEVKDSLLKERVLLDWGTFMVEKNDYDWAESPLLSAVELAKYNNSRLSQAEAYYQLGELYYILEIPVQAQQYYFDALEIFEQEKDSLGVGKCYDGLADNYSNLGDLENSYEYYFKADTLFGLINESELRSNILGNIGDQLILEGYPDSGLAYIQKALSIDYEIANASNLIHHTASLAYYYEGIDSIGTAYDYYTDAHKLALQSEDLTDLAFTNNYLGYHHFYYGSIDSAKYYMTECLKLAEKLSNAQLMTVSSNLLSEVYAEEGAYEEAFKYKKYYTEASDTLFSDKNILGMAYMKSKYAVAKSESEKELLLKSAELAEIKLQNQKMNNYLLSFAAFISFVAFGWVLFYARQRRKVNTQLRKDKEIIESQTKQLQELDKYKSRFFADISHDFRSPLMLIKGYVDILRKEENQFTESSEEALHYISASVERLNGMTDEIRDLVQLQEKRVSLRYVPIHANAFFGMLSEMFSSAATNKGLTLKFDSELAPHEIIHADKYALEKIVFNLIENALKYNTTGSEVNIKLSSTNEGIAMSVCDDGPGINADQISMVFERYYQSSDKAHKGIEGQGIGLNVVKQYVELHGGQIQVTSIPNKETCFKLTLPHNLDQPLHENEVVGNVLDRQLRQVLEKRKILLNPSISNPSLQNWDTSYLDSTSKMILVVEDHPDIRQQISETLSEDYVVLLAATAEEGRFILKTTKDICMLIVDFMLPKLSGQEFIKSVLAEDQHKAIPIIVLNENKDLKKHFGEAMDERIALIKKPIEKSRLLREVEQLLAISF